MSQVYSNPEPLNTPPVPEPPHTPQPDVSTRRHSLWSVLPWVLLAVAGLVIGTQLPRRQAVARTAPSVALAPAPIPTLPDAPPSAGPLTVTLSSAGPLTVTLSSAGSGKHIRVGTPETISAFAGLPEGESATLAVSYTRSGGAKSLLSLAQGSLSSTTWTPSAAGRYEFTASALDSRKSAAFSRPMTIWVDAPQVDAPKIAANPAPQVIIPERPVVAHVPTTAHVPATVRAPMQSKAPVAHHAAKVAPRRVPAHGTSYRVAAARFTYRPVAETLAGALRRRGFHAFVRVGSDSRGKPTYAVETGDYAGLADARQQESLLKHDGYPAFHYSAR